GGKLRTTQRKPQTVAGHWIDRAGRVSGKQQPRDAACSYINGERTEHRRLCYDLRASKTLPQHVVAIGCRSQGALRASHIFQALAAGDEAHIHQSTAYWRHPNVLAIQEVHLAESIRRGHAVKVRSD